MTGKIALLMAVCEGEFELAADGLESFVTACPDIISEFWVLDDASPSHVGEQLVKRFTELTQQSGQVIRLSKSLGYLGMAERLFLALQNIASGSQSFDVVVKLDPDAFVIRQDLGKAIFELCQNQIGLYAPKHDMRHRDSLLYLADLLPFGFKRNQVDGIMTKKWELNRTYPVWWSDIGWRALNNGFRFRYAPGSFWFLGRKTLNSLYAAGYLTRKQDKHGFIFNDDLLLTSVVHAIKHPVIDLGSLSPSWNQTLSMDEQTPLSLLETIHPFVVHPLKNNPSAWKRRDDLRVLRSQLS